MRGSRRRAQDDVLGRSFRSDGIAWRVEALVETHGGTVALLRSAAGDRMRDVRVEALVPPSYRPLAAPGDAD